MFVVAAVVDLLVPSLLPLTAIAGLFGSLDADGSRNWHWAFSNAAMDFYPGGLLAWIMHR